MNYSTDYNERQPITVNEKMEKLFPTLNHQQNALYHALVEWRKKTPEVQGKICAGDVTECNALASHVLTVMNYSPFEQWEVELIAPLLARRIRRKAETGKSIYDPDYHF